MGRPAVDISGQKFGKLTAVNQSDRRDSGGKVYWDCLCDCGNEVSVRGTHLRRGDTVSCGCYITERLVKQNSTHGLTYHPGYQTYYNMMRRCYNPDDKSYKNYGGRGIKVCPLWRYSMVHFLLFCDENGWQPGLEMDRIDNDRGYEPGNIRFVNHKTNMQNTRRKSCHQ